ncbi:MAG: hypothetical protein BM564_08585 [Bacteroidetes bacterium MedPE-SWsnd-G2]|nr:MAG: hypothetical protein BM564_08585 [Bacteroidetes bacterium MedPE-SWsnd-G2]
MRNYDSRHILTTYHKLLLIFKSGKNLIFDGMAIDTIVENTIWGKLQQIHSQTKTLKSELSFITDEHKFFQDLLKPVDMQILSKDDYNIYIEIIDAINRSEKKAKLLLHEISFNTVKLSKQLKSDITSEVLNEAVTLYQDLKVRIEYFEKHYSIMKEQLFGLITSRMKVRKEESIQ